VCGSLHLIETIYRAEDGNIPHLRRHLDRLSRSADALHMACDIEAIGIAIESVEGDGQAKRLRLELSPDGQWRLDTASFEATPANRIWRLKIAKTGLRSTDPLLRHKTTRRQWYEEARREFTTDEADEVLLCNERGEICEGTITTFFLRRCGERTLLTPALSCGLLRGVLRQQQLDSGQAREAILRPEDLMDAESLFVGNALRGLLPAQLA